MLESPGLGQVSQATFTRFHGLAYAKSRTSRNTVQYKPNNTYDSFLTQLQSVVCIEKRKHDSISYSSRSSDLARHQYLALCIGYCIQIVYKIRI
jgi:hypothetical protein